MQRGKNKNKKNKKGKIKQKNNNVIKKLRSSKISFSTNFLAELRYICYKKNVPKLHNNGNFHLKHVIFSFLTIFFLFLFPLNHHHT